MNQILQALIGGANQDAGSLPINMIGGGVPAAALKRAGINVPELLGGMTGQMGQAGPAAAFGIAPGVLRALLGGGR